MKMAETRSGCTGADPHVERGRRTSVVPPASCDDLQRSLGAQRLAALMADVATCGSEASTITDSALARQPPGEVGWITTPTLALPRSMRRSPGVARVQYRMAKY